MIRLTIKIRAKFITDWFRCLSALTPIKTEFFLPFGLEEEIAFYFTSKESKSYPLTRERILEILKSELDFLEVKIYSIKEL